MRGTELFYEAAYEWSIGHGDGVAQPIISRVPRPNPLRYTSRKLVYERYGPPALRPRFGRIGFAPEAWAHGVESPEHERDRPTSWLLPIACGDASTLNADD